MTSSGHTELKNKKDRGTVLKESAPRREEQKEWIGIDHR